MRTLSQIKRDYINATLIKDAKERAKWQNKYNEEFLKALKDGIPWD